MSAELKLIEPPKYAGHYRIGGPQGVLVHFVRRPPWLHRTMTRMLLGWEWIEGTAPGMLR